MLPVYKYIQRFRLQLQLGILIRAKAQEGHTKSDVKILRYNCLSNARGYIHLITSLCRQCWKSPMRYDSRSDQQYHKTFYHPCLILGFLRSLEPHPICSLGRSALLLMIELTFRSTIPSCLPSYHKNGWQQSRRQFHLLKNLNL